MINALKHCMSSADYEEFMKDYKELYIAKKNRGAWELSHTIRNESTNNMIYFKGLFDNSISSPYNYREFKYIISSGIDIDYLLLDYEDKEPYRAKIDTIKRYLGLYFTIHVYIGFIVEEMLYKELSKKALGKQIFRNESLDTIEKTDILFNGVHYQIKNISFISVNDTYKKKLLTNYKKCCRDLYFIFYTIEEDNIYFVAVDGRSSAHINTVEDLSAFNKFTNISLNDYILLLLAEPFN